MDYLETRIRELARGAKWDKLTEFINDYVQSQPKFRHIDLLNKSGIADDAKRRMLTDWLIERHNH